MVHVAETQMSTLSSQTLLKSSVCEGRVDLLHVLVTQLEQLGSAGSCEGLDVAPGPVRVKEMLRCFLTGSAITYFSRWRSRS